MKNKWISRLAWLIFGLISLGTLVLAILTVTQRSPQETIIELVGNLIWVLLPTIFSLIAAVILTYQPRNTIGWLLMIPAAAFALVNPLDSFLAGISTVPPHPTVLFMLLVWYSNWSWLLLIFPLLLIILLFPTGRLPSPRWRWVLICLLGIFLFTLSIISFSPNLEISSGSAVMPNPIGFLPAQAVDFLTMTFGFAFLLLVIVCVASVFIRFRHAAAVEREQIKWLMYATGLFAVFYLPTLGMNLTTEVWGTTDLGNLLLPISFLAFPTAIAIAILRYHLWDIDVIIRRTLVYGGLTILLALVYFGLVTILQKIFSLISGQQSPVSIVISTLAIAALFNPLRTRLQNFIDRRFYRRKYNAEQALANFAHKARDEVEVERLAGELLQVVEETMQPEIAGLWIKNLLLTNQKLINSSNIHSNKLPGSK